MDYQRERDSQLHENARTANENAKLAIEKQGEVVHCLAEIASVFTAGLQRCQTPVATTAQAEQAQRSGGKLPTSPDDSVPACASEL